MCVGQKSFELHHVNPLKSIYCKIEAREGVGEETAPGNGTEGGLSQNETRSWNRALQFVLTAILLRLALL